VWPVPIVRHASRRPDRRDRRVAHGVVPRKPDLRSRRQSDRRIARPDSDPRRSHPRDAARLQCSHAWSGLGGRAWVSISARLVGTPRRSPGRRVRGSGRGPESFREGGGWDRRPCSGDLDRLRGFDRGADDYVTKPSALFAWRHAGGAYPPVDQEPARVCSTRRGPRHRDAACTEACAARPCCHRRWLTGAAPARSPCSSPWRPFPRIHVFYVRLSLQEFSQRPGRFG
jgi:hypothetical protein